MRPDPAPRSRPGATVLAALASLVVLAVIAGTVASRPSKGFPTTRDKLVAAPFMQRPNYLAPVKDPLFGTSFLRITDPGQAMKPDMTCEARLCRHRYSSTQAWNADQSLLVVTNGCGGMCFLDGRTFRPLFHRTVKDDCKWHPRRPDLMVCVYFDRVTLWTPTADTHTVVYAPNDRSALEFGPYKGNLSDDGHRLVLRARQHDGNLIAFVYDLHERIAFPDIPLAALPGRNGYCGISASGRFVICLQTLGDGTETAHVLNSQGEQVQYWGEHHRPGHGDLTLDEDGRDVYVGISTADPDKWHVVKRRLDDGRVTVLARAGYATHASVRNTALLGWVFLSYEGTYMDAAGRPDRAPFHQEVIALRTDGSGQALRIVQTRNVKVDYDSETHASPSPDGTLVVWASNWGQPEGGVADYVARVDWSMAAGPAVGGSEVRRPGADEPRSHPTGSQQP